MLEEDGETVNTGKVWIEWNMVKESAIEIEGQVKCDFCRHLIPLFTISDEHELIPSE